MYCSIEGGGSAEEDRALWLIRPIEDRGAYGWDERCLQREDSAWDE